MSAERIRRRKLLATIGGVTTASLAGCNGVDVGTEPEYEAGEVGDIDGEARTNAEMATAQSAAEGQRASGVTPVDSLEVVDHEFVLESGYLGSTVQGTVENEGTDRIELVEVRVRVYDETGTQLDQYFDSTGDLDGGTSWAFQVILLESPADIADYDIAVLGTPA